MEQANAEEEESQFTQIKPTRKREPKHNVTQGGQEVAWLNASRGEMVGPGTSQEIFEGDSVTLSVHGKFLDRKKQKVNVASFATTGGRTALLDQLNELALNTGSAGGANPIALLNLVDILAKDLQKKEVPEAYLIYALYDQDSNRYEVGKKVLSRNAANQHEELEEKLAIKKNGYIETFVVNETGQDVWFDNMMVMSINSVIVQETHYDPWGLELTGLGFQYGGIKANKYLYNGKELIEDNGLQFYDYGARMYDPAIGRWGVVDPLSHKYLDFSPYNYVLNNPIRNIDPDGNDVIDRINPNSAQGRAMAKFVQTEVGREFLAQFAKAGDVVGGYRFETNGPLSKTTTLEYYSNTTTNEGGNVSSWVFNNRSFGMGNIYEGQAQSVANSKFGLNFSINISNMYDEDRSIITIGHESFQHVSTKINKINKINKIIDNFKSGYYNKKSPVALQSDLNKIVNPNLEHDEARKGNNEMWNKFVDEVVYGSGNTKLIEIYDEWKSSYR